MMTKLNCCLLLFLAVVVVPTTGFAVRSTIPRHTSLFAPKQRQAPRRVPAYDFALPSTAVPLAPNVTDPSSFLVEEEAFPEAVVATTEPLVNPGIQGVAGVLARTLIATIVFLSNSIVKMFDMTPVFVYKFVEQIMSVVGSCVIMLSFSMIFCRWSLQWLAGVLSVPFRWVASKSSSSS